MGMAHERWGTFAVTDHLAKNAFVNEVLLFDRLVIPVPPSRDLDPTGQELLRWRTNGWNPEALDPLLDILGELARPVPWTIWRQQSWADRFAAGREATKEAALGATRTELTQGLPSYVEGVEAVGVFRSLDKFNADVKPKADVPPGKISATDFWAVLGQEFLSTPDDPKRSHCDLLTEAVEIASAADFKRKRASFYRWQREFIKDGFADDEALKRAIEEMSDLAKDYRDAASKAAWRTGLTFVFTVAPLALAAVLAPPAAPAAAAVAIGGAFFTVASFATGAILPEGKTSEPLPAAIVYDIRKGFGWA
jgi:hypothetical protein